MKLIPNLADIDRQAIQQYGIPALDLMERAGGWVAEAVRIRADAARRVVIMAGPGNNGGDGFVCARLLQRAGFSHVSVLYTGSAYKGESLANFEALMGLPVEMVDVKAQAKLALGKVRHADILVDALLGSGLSRPVSGLEADLINAANENSQAYTVAVDIPSGVDGATGTRLNVAIDADVTVTFAAAKPGLYLFPGKGLAGQIRVVDIGIPEDLIEADESPLRLIDPAIAKSWLPVRRTDAHKYDFGNLLIVAGSRKMPGAAVLCAESAIASGVGLVTLAAPQSVLDQMRLSPELMRLPLPETQEGALGVDALSPLQQMLAEKRFDAIAIGPGLGHLPETVGLIWQLLSGLLKELPVILDADGLNALSLLGDESFEPRMSRPNLGVEHPQWILTPHIGEAGRLLKRDKAELHADLPKAVRALQDVWSATSVLKSASTVVATLDGLLWISPAGTTGLAKAGSGDVLTGLIAGLAAQRAAQGLSIAEAAPLGVYLHGLAAEAAASELTPYAMRAGQLQTYFPQAFSAVLNGALPA